MLTVGLPVGVFDSAQAAAPEDGSLEEIRSWYFGADGDTWVPASDEDPIDRVSNEVYRFSTQLGEVSIFAVGAQPGHASVTDGTKSTSRFHTTQAAKANLPSDASNKYKLILLCRATIQGVESSCQGLSMEARVGSAAFTGTQHLDREDMISTTGLPSLNPFSPDGRFRNDPRFTQFDPTLRFGNSVGPEATHKLTYSVFAFPLAVQDGTLPGEATSPDRCENLSRCDHGRVGVAQIQVADHQGSLGAIREPVWRTGTEDDEIFWGDAGPDVSICTDPVPDPGRLDEYVKASSKWSVTEATRQTIGSFSNSCRTMHEGSLTFTWEEILSIKGLGADLQDATKIANQTKFADTWETFLSEHFAIETPRERLENGEDKPFDYWRCPSGWPSMPCVDVLFPAQPPILDVATVEVFDQGNWIPAREPSRVYGGPTKITFDVAGPLTAFNGTPAAWPGGATRDQGRLEILIEPTPPGSNATGVEVIRPEERHRGGLIYANASENTAGTLPGDLHARASVVPFVTDPVDQTVSAYMQDWYDKNSTRMLESCVIETWSHNDLGLFPNTMENVRGELEPADHLASDPDNRTSCETLTEFIRLHLPLHALGAILEIRTGDAYSLEFEVPAHTGLGALEHWANGTLDRSAWKTPVSLLAVEDAPWTPSQPGYPELETNDKVLLPRITATLPEHISKPRLAATALHLTSELQPLLLSAFLEIENLPQTAGTATALSEIRSAADSLGISTLPMFVAAGNLPEPVWDMHPYEKLFTMRGLATAKEFITIGSGSIENGVDPWTRMGPAPHLVPKPDFLAPSPVGTTVGAVMNVVPLVEMLHLAGFRETEVIRAALAGMAVPYRGTTPVHSFYMQGYGVLDPTLFIEDLLGRAVSPLNVTDAARQSLSYQNATAYPKLGPEWTDSTGPYVDYHASATAYGEEALVTMQRRVYRYDPTEDEVTELDVDLGYCSCIRTIEQANDRAYTFGGDSAEIQRIDPDAETVSTIDAELPGQRQDLGTVWTGEEIYLFGGVGEDQYNGVPRDEILRFNPATETVATLDVTLPAGVRYSSAVWTGEEAYVFAREFDSDRQADVIRFDPETETVEPIDARTPDTRDLVDAVWTGHTALVFGDDGTVLRFEPATGALEELPDNIRLGYWAHYIRAAFWDGETVYAFPENDKITRYRPEYRSAGPEHVAGPLAPAVLEGQGVEDPADLAGLSLPPNALDPLSLGHLPQFHLDLPMLPATLVTDWGVTDHRRSHAAGLKMLDIGTPLNTTLEDLNTTLSRVLNITEETSRIQPIIDQLPNVTFEPGNDVAINTTHYNFFDLLESDYLFGMQADLLNRSIADVPNPGSEDPTAELRNVTDAILPSPYHLVEQVQAHSQAKTKSFDEDLLPGCSDVSHILDSAAATTEYINEYKKVFNKASTQIPIAQLPTDLDGAWLGSKTRASGPVQFAEGKACSITDLVWLIEYLEFLREEVHKLAEVRQVLAPTGSFAAKYLDPRPEAVTYDILNGTELGPRVNHVVQDGIEDANHTVQAVEAHLDDAVLHVEELIVKLNNLKARRHQKTTHPSASIASIPERTTAAPLGPYVGLTTLTSRNITVYNPLTGEPVSDPIGDGNLTRNVTVPLPSLLWNNPALFSKLEYRDGNPTPDAGFLFRKPSWSIFNRTRVNASIAVDGLQVPLLSGLDDVLGLPPDNVTDVLDGLNRTQLTQQLQDATGAIAPELEPPNATDPEALNRTALHLIDGILERTLQQDRPCPISCLEGYLIQLYSKPRTVGGWTNESGYNRIGDFFPNQGSRLYTPYYYGSLHGLVEESPYAGIDPGRTVDAIHDIDQRINQGLADVVAGEDGAKRPSEEARWAHRPAPAKLPVRRGEPVIYPRPTVEVHDLSVADEIHQFQLNVSGNVDPIGLACYSLQRQNEIFSQMLEPGLGIRCPRLWDADVPHDSLPSPADLPDLTCEALNNTTSCISGARAALENTTESLKAAVDACTDAVHQLHGCKVLARTQLILTEVLEMLGAVTGDEVVVPWMTSLTRTIDQNRIALGLNKTDLVNRTLLENPDATVEEVNQTVTEILEDLPKFIDLAIDVDEPPRAKNVSYRIAQGIKSHATDRVSGLEWTSGRFPPRLDDVDSTDLVLETLDEGIEELADETVKTWAIETKNTLEEMDDPSLKAAIQPPTTQMIRTSHANGNLSWRPGGQARGVSFQGAPDPLTVNVDLGEISRDLKRTTGLSLGPGADGTTLDMLHTPFRENANWSDRVRTAATLTYAHDNGFDPEQTAQTVAATASDALSWRIDRSNDTIRATSATMTPKIGIHSYSVPVAPNEILQLRTDGEYYLENTDALLVVTPHEAVKDALLAVVEPLSQALGDSPGDRAQQVASFAYTTAENVLEGRKPMIRVEHINPAVRVDHQSRTTHKDTIREDEILTRIGGLRVKEATNSFEMFTKNADVNQLHVMLVYFPLIDSKTVEGTAQWISEIGTEFDTVQDAQDYLSSLKSKFIVDNFTLAWDTYVGYGPVQRGGYSETFHTPWRPNMEDVKLYWSVPSGSYPDELDFQATAQGPNASQQAVTEDDVKFTTVVPQYRRGSSWNTPCGEQYASGVWHTPAGFAPVGIPAEYYMTGGPTSEVGPTDKPAPRGACKTNDVNKLLPTKRFTAPFLWPHCYNAVGKSELAWLQYDLNTPYLQFESHPRAEICFNLPSVEYSALAELLSGSASGAGAGIGSLLSAADVTGKVAPIAGTALGAGTNVAETGKGLGLALARKALASTIGAGSVDDLQLTKSYTGKPSYGLGFGGTVSHWAVLNETHLYDLTGGSWDAPTDTRLTLQDTEPYHPNKLYEPPDRPLALFENAPAKEVTLWGDADEPVGDVTSASAPGASLDLGWDFLNATASAAENTTGGDDDGDRLGNVLETLLEQEGSPEIVRVLVGFEDERSLNTGVGRLRSISAAIEHVYPSLDVVLATVPVHSIEKLGTFPGVTRIEADARVSATLDSSTEAMGAPQARDAHNVTGRNVTIAVVDTGVDAGHGALDDLDDDPNTTDPKVTAWHDAINGREDPYDDHGHGTHVASTAAGTPNDSPYTGVAPGAELVGVKVLNEDGVGSRATVLAGIDWLARHQEDLDLDVVSLSLGGRTNGDGSSLFEQSLTDLTEDGITVAVAAGNSGPQSNTVTVPATAHGVIAVGATDDRDEVATFSSRGPTADGRLKPDVSAPGVFVTAAYAGTTDGYVMMSGTSMATPHVSGLAALMIEEAGGVLHVDRLRDTLLETTIDRGDAGPDNSYGYGTVEASNTLANLDPPAVDTTLLRVQLPSGVEPGEPFGANVTLRNHGVQTAKPGQLEVRIDGTVVTSRGINPLGPREERTLDLGPWSRAQLGDHQVNISLEPDPGETQLYNNERSFTVVISDLYAGTLHEWVALSQRIDPGRYVFLQETETKWEQEPRENRDRFLARAFAGVFDGFQGSGDGILVEGKVRSQAMPGAHPLYGDHVEAYAQVDKVDLYFAPGGFADYERDDATRARYTPPEACWDVPMADEGAFAHTMCWQGQHSTMRFQENGVTVDTSCMGKVDDWFTELTEETIDQVVRQYEAGLTVTDRILWPLYTASVDPEPPSEHDARNLTRYFTLDRGPFMDKSAEIAGCLASAAQIQSPLVAPFHHGFTERDTSAACQAQWSPDWGGGCGASMVSGHALTYPFEPRTKIVPLPLGAPLTPPYNLAAQSGPDRGEITLTWDPPLGYVTNYEVQRQDPGGAWETIATVERQQSYTDGGLEERTPYTYRVIAIREDQRSDPTDPETTVAAGPPTRIRNLTGQGQSDFDGDCCPYKIRLRWDEPASDGGGDVTYKIEQDITMTPQCGQDDRDYWTRETGYPYTGWTDHWINRDDADDFFCYRVWAENQWGLSAKYMEVLVDPRTGIEYPGTVGGG